MIKQNLFLGLIFTIILTPAVAQKTVNQFDKNAKRHGLWTKNYDKTDQKRYEGVFDHGKEIDSFKYYTLSDGKSVLSAVKVFNRKNNLSYVTFFASDKCVISKGKMDGRKYIGEWVFYHKNSKAPMIIETYNDDGLLQGERFVYYKNGIVAEKAKYKNGKLNGEATWLNENNTLLRLSNYTDDELNGYTVNHDANGTMVSEGDYIKDEKVGIWRYYENGEVSKKIDHTNKKVIFKKE